MILSEKIRRLPTNDGKSRRCAPVLSERLGVFDPCPEPVKVFANCSLERDASVGINRIAGSCQYCSRESPIRIEVRSLATTFSDGFSTVATHKEPLTRLPFELNDIEQIVVGKLVGRLESTPPLPLSSPAAAGLQRRLPPCVVSRRFLERRKFPAQARTKGDD